MYASNAEDRTAQLQKEQGHPSNIRPMWGNHTANYKGCEYYQTLVQRHTVHTTSGRKPFITNETPYIHPPTSNQHFRSYANVLSNKMNTDELT
jgi:hypothetical protein